MKNKINLKYASISFLGILVCLQIVSALPFYYDVSLDYKSGKLTINEINLISSERIIYPGQGDYFVKVFDRDNNIIYTDSFQIPLTQVSDTINETSGELISEQKTFNEASFNILVPYNEGYLLIISDKNDNQLASVRINDILKMRVNNEFKDTLNNDNSNADSNSNLIAQDLPKDTGSDNLGSNNLIFFWVFLFLVLIIVVFIIYFIRRK